LDEESRTKLHQLSDRIADVMEIVAGLAEQINLNINEAKDCNRAIAEVAAKYRAILASVSESDQLTIERRYGRKVVKLRQQASFLPEDAEDGQSVALASDQSGEFMARVSTSINSPAPRKMGAAVDVDQPGVYRVCGELDAWCGACHTMRQHTIVVVVDNKPKQVICSTCNAQHGYRLTPARSKDAGTRASGPKKNRPPTKEEARARRAKEENLAIQSELAQATNIRPFKPRMRYKAGEIIEHQEYGRGKIENVLKGSLLVRFRTGLRSIMNL